MKEQENQMPINNEIQDINAVIYFLYGLHENSMLQTRHLDTQINIFLGINSAVLFFTLTQLSAQKQGLHFLVLTIFSIVAVLISLFAIHPPRFMRKKGQLESLLYHNRIQSFPSFVEYKQELMKTVQSLEAMIEQYAIAVYNIASYHYRPKRRLFKAARIALLIGLILSFLIFSFNLV